MAKKKKTENKAIVVEFHVWMHCDGCEKTVAKIISKIEGVETFTTDIIRHKVVITGRINPEKIMKKIKKKTGKIMEILSKEDHKEDFEKEKYLTSEDMIRKQFIDSLIFGYVGDDKLYTLFNDENANACSIM